MNLEKYIRQQLREAYNPLPNQAHIDALLDKINAQGFDSLNLDDKHTLRNTANGEKEVPLLMKAGLLLMSWHKNPVKSKPVEKPDGTTVVGIKNRNNGVAIGILRYRPEGHVELAFNEKLWEFVRNAAEVTDKEVIEGIQHWAAYELALQIEPQNISQAGLIMPKLG